LPALMLGFILLAPLFVWLVDRLFSRSAAAVLGVRYALLRQQLSGGLWRVAGTCAALMVGLSVLIVMQTQGHSALSSWQLPDKFPDVFIYTTSRAGLDPAAQDAQNSTSVAKLATVTGSASGLSLLTAVTTAAITRSSAARSSG
jgi:hypothetical protein